MALGKILFAEDSVRHHLALTALQDEFGDDRVEISQALDAVVDSWGVVFLGQGRVFDNYNSLTDFEDAEKNTLEAVYENSPVVYGWNYLTPIILDKENEFLFKAKIIKPYDVKQLVEAVRQVLEPDS